MPSRTDTRSRILATAQPLLLSRGFNGFSYRHLADALGIRTAAVHYHFPAKANLGVELVAQLAQEFDAWSSSLDDAGDGPLLRLEAFFEVHKRFLKQDVVSPSGILQSEFGALPEGMRREVASLAAKIHRWVTGVLNEGLETGELAFVGDPNDQAVVVVATVQGALQIARTFGPEGYEAATSQLMRLMIPGHSGDSQ